MSFKISPKIPPAHRKALRDFMQNPYVAAKVVIGDFDHLLAPEVKEQLIKDRTEQPEIVKAAWERLERGIRAGKVKP